ncbi:MAG TPA: FAD-dependent oxidoreductase [Myxococcota bacterium]|nr:FAD-dependent oxidoreductase [Myxococcota bacterium]
MSRVVVLGGGPAGVGAALELVSRGHEAVLVERETRVGGNAGSFELAGVRVDYGSHRLHPASDPAILGRLRELLGDELLVRPRHGRIRLLGRWIHFPLRPLDLALRLHPRFAAGVGRDAAAKLLRRGPAPGADDTFASVLEHGLGRTICREFYFPYARKIWGLEPEAISPVQAWKRVSAGSLGKLARRLLPGGAGSGGRQAKGVFFYPRRGYGQISERLAQEAERRGARLLLGTDVTRVRLRPGGRHQVETRSTHGADALEADHVWSTIPIGVFARLTEPSAPPDVLEAASGLSLRAMLLVYLVLDCDRFSEFDAHYFPEAGLPFTRVSEPKNYAALSEPRGRTVLCAEIPCDRGDPLFRADAASLSRLVCEGLARAALPVTARVLEVEVKRLPAAYPIYHRGYEARFDRLDGWVERLEGVLSFGRQGLYAHDNTHHALFMAWAAAECLAPDGRFDRAAWGRFREVFARHVVED